VVDSERNSEFLGKGVRGKETMYISRKGKDHFPMKEWR
jgi:hypothetical protein